MKCEVETFGFNSFLVIWGEFNSVSYYAVGGSRNPRSLIRLLATGSLHVRVKRGLYAPNDGRIKLQTPVMNIELW